MQNTRDGWTGINPVIFLTGTGGNGDYLNGTTGSTPGKRNTVRIKSYNGKPGYLGELKVQCQWPEDAF